MNTTQTQAKETHPTTLAQLSFDFLETKGITQEVITDMIGMIISSGVSDLKPTTRAVLNKNGIVSVAHKLSYISIEAVSGSISNYDYAHFDDTEISTLRQVFAEAFCQYFQYDPKQQEKDAHEELGVATLVPIMVMVWNNDRRNHFKQKPFSEEYLKYFKDYLFVNGLADIQVNYGTFIQLVVYGSNDVVVAEEIPHDYNEAKLANTIRRAVAEHQKLSAERNDKNRQTSQGTAMKKDIPLTQKTLDSVNGVIWNSDPRNVQHLVQLSSDAFLDYQQFLTSIGVSEINVVDSFIGATLLVFRKPAHPVLAIELNKYYTKEGLRTAVVQLATEMQKINRVVSENKNQATPPMEKPSLVVTESLPIDPETYAPCLEGVVVAIDLPYNTFRVLVSNGAYISVETGEAVNVLKTDVQVGMTVYFNGQQVLTPFYKLPTSV